MSEYPDLYMAEVGTSPWTARHRAAVRRAFPIVHVNGYALMEHPALRYDEVRIDEVAGCALVGEVRHVMYQSDLNSIKQAMCNDLAAILSDFAARVGVAYPLEDR